MRTKFLNVLCLLLLVHTGLLAQSYLGIHIGVNSGKFSGDSPKDFRYAGKLQFNAGVVFDLRLKDDIFLSIFPSHVISGSKLQYPFEIDEDESEYRDSIDLKLKVFTLPMALKIISDNQRWQFLSGFELSFPYQLLADNSVQEVDLIDDINSMVLNIIFGIGYKIPIQKSFLVINLAYSQGLTNLANNEDAYDSLLPRVRSTSFRLTTAWMLPVGKPKN